MNGESSDYDVMNIELPEYEESSFPFPDAPAESSFAENKDEIFLRNMIIAAKEAKLPAQREKYPENFGVEEIFLRNKSVDRTKKSGSVSFFRRAAMFLDGNFNLKIIYSILLLTFIAVMTILLTLTFQVRGRLKNSYVPVEVQAETVIMQAETDVTVTMTVSYEEVTAETEILREQVTEVIPYRAVTASLTEKSVLN